MRRTLAGFLCLVAAAGCRADAQSDSAQAEGLASADAAPPALGQLACEIAGPSGTLADEVRETSGLALGRRSGDVFWTHNDAGGEPMLYALSPAGAVLGRVRVSGAELRDWEDIEAGSCAAGECLYIGDIGDNDGERDAVVVYEVPEPEPAVAETSPASRLTARFPDGPRDAEALFRTSDGGLHLVTKGRGSSIDVYRFPSSAGGAGVLELVRVRELFPEPADEDDRVTAATATPDGRWVAARTYSTLYVYPAADLLGGRPVEPLVADLQPLGHGQGESLAMADDGTVWVTSEAANADDRPRWATLRCALPPQSQGP